jgi:hypothetical protein
MLQQIIALLIILSFIGRLFSQKKQQAVTRNEFILWLSFWLLAIVAIIFIKDIDQLLHALGFSLSGINFLIYLTVIILCYLVFKLRLSLAKLDQNITEVARQVALHNKK